MNRKLFFFIVGLVLIATLITLAITTHRDRSHIHIVKYVTNIERIEGAANIDEEDVIHELQQMFPSGKTKSIDSIDVHKIEEKLKQNGLFEKVNVYYTLEGELHVDITPAEPVFLVVSDDKSYYVSKAHKCIPAEQLEKYSQPLLVVYGDVDEQEATGEIYDLCNLISSDAYWSSFFTGIRVQPGSKNVVADTQYDHLSINFGSMGDWKYKLWQLRTFIDQAIPKVGWQAYSQISLEYPNRITATELTSL